MSPLCDNLQVRALECTGPDRTAGGIRFGFDSAGYYYEVGTGTVELPNQDIILVLRRIAPDGSQADIAQLYTRRCDSHPCTPSADAFAYYGSEVVHLDVTNGRIWLVIESKRCSNQGCDSAADARRGIVEIGGLPQLFDTLLTFTPGGQLSALVPAHPDGLRAADTVQVWSGGIASMPDWSQAEPLACSAATSPTPGQVVTVSDTQPDPPVGSGRYYLTASQSGPDRRLGRQYVNGAFSARNSSPLPVCEGQ